MELLTKTLDVMFRRLSPEHLLLVMLQGGENADFGVWLDGEIYKKIFLTYAESVLGGYSWNEQSNIFRLYRLDGDRADKKDSCFPPFAAVLQAAERLLIPGQKGPECRFEEVIHWRDAYLLLGQDLFTCAWLARQPERRFVRRFFSWPAVIPVANRILARITEGAAENHMHLYAGASVFSLFWTCLMNHPDSIRDVDKMEQLLQQHEIRSVSGNLWSIKRKMLYAAFLRARLFLKIQGQEGSLLDELRMFHRLFFSEDYSCVSLKEEIDNLRFLYGVSFSQPTYLKPVCLDYAFTRELASEAEEDSRLLAGERHLLFSCFRELFRGGFSWGDQWVFYLYLLLKSQIRSELVQVNRQVGFANFRNYDSRKKLLWKRYPEYLREDIRQSINAPFHEQRLGSLEGRIVPEMSAKLNIASVHEIDRIALYFGGDQAAREALKRWELCCFMDNPARGKPFFYVYHFPKNDDEPISDDVHASLLCRHDKNRRVLRTCGIAVARALANCPYLCERIRAIDACSNELVCRPEVFATLFRFLRSFRPEDYWDQIYTNNKMGKPRLSATYHVGEDFLDIADGLRAMDEVLRFLDLRHGDRFGHAIALGVNPELHYRCKFNQSVLSKQELLDDLVWIYYRSSELQIVIPEPLRHRIRAESQGLFGYIYGTASPNGRSYTLREYYYSQFLRGDDPRCYVTGRYRPIEVLDPYDLYCENTYSDVIHPLEEYRNNEHIAELYHLYHYCLPAKRRGQEMKTWQIDTAYIRLMESLQRAMRELISRRGISLECNPSSNVLIGTFGTYQDHPILTFNNLGLTSDCSGTQMHVSINSDDPGVFDTTVSFEYALLARTLCDMEDESGRPLYSERQVEDYLRNIARMGNEQIFPPCESEAQTLFPS